MGVTLTAGDVQLKDMIEMSEPGNALRLALIAKGRIHYVSTWNAWVVFKDGRWVLDDGGVTLQKYAKMVPQSLFTMASGMKSEEDKDYKELHIAWGRKSNTEPQLKRMVTLARDLDGMVIESDDLDTHPFLLNVLNGTYDFTTNEFRDHDPGDLLTKMANVMYDPVAQCPLWLKCLDQWQPDKSVQRFLQEITGSGLIGEPVQNLFVNVGEGRNGKGTFYKQVQGILGTGRTGYAGTAPEDMLVETRWRVHEEETARLRGIRFLLAPETSVGDRLDEAGIKNMTGGDVMHARHLYGKTFDFKPTHTAFLHTNYDPQIRGTDSGIWNRVKKIRWETYIKEDQRDRYIDDKLEAEFPGIFNWLIEGCKRWRKDGLQVPPKVAQDTEGYRSEQDHVGRFLSECMTAMVLDADSGPGGHVEYMPAATLRKHYVLWCEQEGVKPWVTATVGKELRHKGWEPGWGRSEGKSVRVWEYKKSESAVAAQPSDQDSNSSATAATALSLLNPIVNLVGEESQWEDSTENAVIAVAAVAAVEDDQEERHREWLYDHGYPVPPTDEEIEAYQRQQEEEYEHPYDQTPEAPEPPEIG